MALEDCGSFAATGYQIATANVAHTARNVGIYRETRFSDHAPLAIEYDLPL